MWGCVLLHKPDKANFLSSISPIPMHNLGKYVIHKAFGRCLSKLSFPEKIVSYMPSKREAPQHQPVNLLLLFMTQALSYSSITFKGCPIIRLQQYIYEANRPSDVLECDLIIVNPNFILSNDERPIFLGYVKMSLSLRLTKTHILIR